MRKIEIRPNGTKRVYTVNTEKSKTDPSFKHECDVNNIVKMYIKTGDESLLKQRVGQYLDSSEFPDFMEAQNIISEAKQTFAMLPAQLRKKFNNNPQEMLNYLQDPQNDEEAIKLGLKVKRQKEEKNPPLPTPTDPTVDKPDGEANDKK